MERAFRELKGFIKIRPMYHHTDDRIKAHVFLCVLAYTLERVLVLQCRKLPRIRSARRALGLLSQLKAIECTVGETTMVVTNRVNREIAAILEALGVVPVSKILQP